MIDTKQSFRKGSVIVEIHIDEPTVEGAEMRVTKVPTDYGSINKAKKANRLTQYRTIPHALTRRGARMVQS